MRLELLSLSLGLIGGIAAGGAFFGGLYLSTQRLAKARHPALLMIAGSILRVAVVLVGAWIVATMLGLWSVLAYLVGITGARIILVQLVRSGTSDARESV
jgi:F1F0 ATPase subunit 2